MRRAAARAPAGTRSKRLLLRRLILSILVLLPLLGGTALAAQELLLPEPDGDVLTLLLLGSDDGPPRGGDLRNARADAFHLLFVSGDRQHASFVSIPRDSWVDVAGWGTTRINACLNNGPDGCVETVEGEFGVEVDGYLLTSMNGLKGAFEEFGGVTVDVTTPLFNGGQDIAETGPQTLSGSQTLTYARDRKNRSGGDFQRSQAQSELLAIAHRQVSEAGSIERVIEAVTALRRHTVTDLSGPELLRLGFEAMRLPPENVSRELVPAGVGRAGAASVVFLDAAAYDLIDDAAADGRIDEG